MWSPQKPGHGGGWGDVGVARARREPGVGLHAGRPCPQVGLHRPQVGRGVNSGHVRIWQSTAAEAKAEAEATAEAEAEAEAEAAAVEVATRTKYVCCRITVQQDCVAVQWAVRPVVPCGAVREEVRRPLELSLHQVLPKGEGGPGGSAREARTLFRRGGWPLMSIREPEVRHIQHRRGCKCGVMCG